MRFGLNLNWLKGELREYDNPENRQFLAAIMKGTVLAKLNSIYLYFFYSQDPLVISNERSQIFSIREGKHNNREKM